MSNYNSLKATINANVKTNGNQEITGSIMNSVLNAMVNTLGAGYQYMGVAIPSTNPGTPDAKVCYVAATPGTYTNFKNSSNVALQVADGEVAILKYDTAWSKEVTGAATAAQLTQLGQELNGEMLPYTKTSGKYIVYSTGVESSSSANSCSSYIDVEGFDAIIYARLYVTSSTSAAGMAFYDSSKNYISGQRVVRNSSPQRYVPTKIAVPANAKYARFTISNSLADFFVRATNGVIDEISDIRDEITRLDNNIGDIDILLEGNNLVYTEISGGYINYANGAIVTGGTTTNYCDFLDISQYTRLRYSRGVSTSTSTVAGMAFYDSSKNYISGQRFIRGADGTGYIDTVIDVPSGAKYARFSIWISVTGFYVNDMLGVVDNIGITSMLKDKKISIIGDSISCFGTQSQTRNDGYNAPYWIVKSIDVGQEIQSWVTWLDVYASVDGTTPTGKTIGGVALTAAMIGTKQSFTPVSEDVGKEIGVARWASAYTAKPWWQVLIDKTGATLCNNASWSGARIIPIPEGNSRHDAFVLSEAYSDYTLGRVANRDDDGNIITPDIIIIFRGTNDFSATDPEGGVGTDENEPIATPNMMTFDSIADVHNFTQGYIWTILKLRERYPFSYIVVCTLNIFKRRNADKYPPNNGDYTLPDYNNKIREIANLMGCGLIEFDKDGITFENCYPTYISDSASTPTHPNTTGHYIMGLKAFADLSYCLKKN